VLVYGKTEDPPYEYFVTLPKNHKQEYPKNLVVLDTLMNHKTIRFIGNPLSEPSRKSLEIDLNAIFQSLELGPTYRKQISTVFDIVNKYQSSNKFYAALNEIQEFPTYDKQEDWTKLQMELTFSSFLGPNSYYDTYLEQLESRFTPKDGMSDLIQKNTVIGSAVFDTLIKEARTHQIVMINENHFYPNHRLLILDLLPKLKELGYHYLALEALDTGQDSLLNLANSYPTLDTGFYTSEQNYSQLIREAKTLGYEFVAYENTDKNKNREVGQAENLYQKTFQQNPESKVLVLAGIDHILEKPSPSGKAWMASLFKSSYQIDPLTISQTHLNSYRKQIAAPYGLIHSEVFDSDRWRSVDYLILNNQSSSPSADQEKFSYKNQRTSEVQVSLFYGDEILNSYDYHKKVPYFTTIIAAGKTCEVPIPKHKEVYLYTFDKSGNRLDKQIITASTKPIK